MITNRMSEMINSPMYSLNYDTKEDYYKDLVMRCSKDLWHIILREFEVTTDGSGIENNVHGLQFYFRISGTMYPDFFDNELRYVPTKKGVKIIDVKNDEEYPIQKFYLLAKCGTDDFNRIETHIFNDLCNPLVTYLQAHFRANRYIVNRGLIEHRLQEEKNWKILGLVPNYYYDIKDEWYKDRDRELSRAYVNCLYQDYYERFCFTQYPILITEEHSPLVITSQNTFYLFLPIGITVDDFISKKSKIESLLEWDISIEEVDKRIVCIKILNEFYQDEYMPKFNSYSRLEGMEFYLGKTKSDALITLNLNDNFPHTLIAGTNGSGKSNFLSILIFQFLSKNIETYIMDFKSLDFVMFEDNYKLHLDTDIPSASITASKLRKVVDNRFQILREARCRNFKEYNKKYPSNQMSPIILLADEFSDVATEKTSESKSLLDDIHYLLRKSRACNFYIFISLQRPDAQLLNGKMKSQLQNAIVFKTTTEVDSEIALSRKGDYRAYNNLEKSGEAILNNQGEKYFKAFYMNDDELKQALIPYLDPNKPKELSINDIENINHDSNINDNTDDKSTNKSEKNKKVNLFKNLKTKQK